MKSLCQGIFLLIIISMFIASCGGSGGNDTTDEGSTITDDTSTTDDSLNEDNEEDNSPGAPYETSPVKLKYIHDLTIDYSGGVGSLTIHWTTNGEVAAPVVQTAIESIVCNDEFSEGAAYKLQGTSSIELKGTWDMDNDNMACHCDIDSEIQATMRGIVHNKPNNNGCTSQTTNLEVEEKWYNSASADCTCDAKAEEYEDDAIMMQAQYTQVFNSIIPANTQPNIIPENHSFEFPYPGDGMQIQETFDGQPGSGTYTWQYHSPTLDVTPNPDDFYEDPEGQPWWTDQDGTYGPPLDSITLNLVSDWNDY